MILSNITQATQFLPSLNLTLANDRFTDFFRRGQAWLVSHVIGEEVEEILEMEVALAAPDDHAELRLLCQRVIAEKALLDAIPEMDMQLTEAGFAVQNNDDFSPASSQRVDRLLAKMPERIAADVDALVRFLLKNSKGSGTYDYWRGTEQFKHLTMAFIPFCEDYNGLADAGHKLDYEEYYAAIGPAAMEMKKVADYYVSRAEIERLLELYRDGETLRVHRVAILDLRCAAVAAHCGDLARARNAAVRAREVMLAAPDSFPAFKASPAYNTPTVNLDGGKIVNML